jgi:protein TonB
MVTGGGGATDAKGPVGEGRAPSDGGTPGVPAGVSGKGLAVPKYPFESVRWREEGVVRVEVEILPDGSIGQVKVLSDPGFPRLVDAALAAVRKSRFTPAYEGDHPVRATVRFPFIFSLR